MPTPSAESCHYRQQKQEPAATEMGPGQFVELSPSLTSLQQIKTLCQCHQTNTNIQLTFPSFLKVADPYRWCPSPEQQHPGTCPPRTASGPTCDSAPCLHAVTQQFEETKKRKCSHTHTHTHTLITTCQMKGLTPAQEPSCCQYILCSTDIDSRPSGSNRNEICTTVCHINGQPDPQCWFWQTPGSTGLVLIHLHTKSGSQSHIRGSEYVG